MLLAGLQEGACPCKPSPSAFCIQEWINQSTLCSQKNASTEEMHFLLKPSSNQDTFFNHVQIPDF